jgi:hypothetical protein
MKQVEKQLDLKRKLEFKSEDLEKQGDNMPGTIMKRPMMKKGGKALKPVKPNQKGLKKLPKKVRNKMGYMKNGGKVK